MAKCPWFNHDVDPDPATLALDVGEIGNCMVCGLKYVVLQTDPSYKLARDQSASITAAITHPMLSRFKVPPRSTMRITMHPHANTTLWVDSGSIHLADDPDKHPISGGPVALERGPVVVRNPNKTPAVVFAAVNHAPPELASVVAAKAGAIGNYDLVCSVENRLESGLTYAECTAKKEAHNAAHEGELPEHRAQCFQRKPPVTDPADT
jgi:hypothetical protein